jgi:glycosyltransferase involved in cell wall biosynthesis
MPLITTKVGGIPEIYGHLSDRLVPPQDVGALAQVIADTLDHPDRTSDLAGRLRDRVAELFSVDKMVDGVLEAYAAGIDQLQRIRRR